MHLSSRRDNFSNENQTNETKQFLFLGAAFSFYSIVSISVTFFRFYATIKIVMLREFSKDLEYILDQYKTPFLGGKKEEKVEDKTNS